MIQKAENGVDFHGKVYALQVRILPLPREIQHHAGQGEMVADPDCIGIQDGALNPATFFKEATHDSMDLSK